ncbi:hypothetical protein M569_16464 [Genlisea aurea]|uniref:Uncharacterized protein n=1 Tax=Genlisea aurea TaxID=192259 RepID=S8C1T3_9LAMI|nr:hypothetical protein M569_16464 [Genlisea aurea]
MSHNFSLSIRNPQHKYRTHPIPTESVSNSDRETNETNYKKHSVLDSRDIAFGISCSCAERKIQNREKHVE